jgi:hypothetical protein
LLVSYTRKNAISAPSTWLELNATAVELLLAVTLFIGSASLLAMASGDPEPMALVALTGIAVVVIGTALLRFSERLRTEEMVLP